MVIYKIECITKDEYFVHSVKMQYFEHQFRILLSIMTHSHNHWIELINGFQIPPILYSKYKIAKKNILFISNLSYELSITSGKLA